MNVGLHHRGVHAQLLAIFQAELDGTLDHGLVDGLHGGRGEPVKGAVEGVVLGHTMAVEVGKAAQGIAVINAFAQLAIVRVLDAHQDEGAQGLRGGDAAASGVGVLQSARQILAHLLDQRAWSSRNPTIPCRRGSRWTPWFRNSRSAKLSWGSAIRVMLSSPGAGVAGSTGRCVPRWP